MLRRNMVDLRKFRWNNWYVQNFECTSYFQYICSLIFRIISVAEVSNIFFPICIFIDVNSTTIVSVKADADWVKINSTQDQPILKLSSKTGQKSFQYRGVYAWNSLPVDTRGYSLERFTNYVARLFVINIFQYNYTKVQTSGVISEEFMYVYTFLFFILVFLNLYASIFNFVQ